jgi:hypothetical protein
LKRRRATEAASGAPARDIRLFRTYAHGRRGSFPLPSMRRCLAEPCPSASRTWRFHEWGSTNPNRRVRVDKSAQIGCCGRVAAKGRSISKAERKRPPRYSARRRAP